MPTPAPIAAATCADRRECDGRAGIRPRPGHREPHRPPPADLRLLRAVHPGIAALAAHRARSPRAGTAGPCAGEPSMPAICRSIARARSLTGRGSIRIVRPSPIGSANPPPCWNPLPMPSAAIFCRPRRSSPMTRQSACWPPAPAKPGQQGSGPMPATNAPGAAPRRPPPGIGSPVTGKASIPRTTSPATGAGCT